MTITTLKLSTTLVTPKVPGVHKLTLNEEVWTNNGLGTLCTNVTLWFYDLLFSWHARRAVNMSGLRVNFVSFSYQICTAPNAYKMLRMESKTIGIHNFAFYNIVTNFASFGKKVPQNLVRNRDCHLRL